MSTLRLELAKKVLAMHEAKESTLTLTIGAAEPPLERGREDATHQRIIRDWLAQLPGVWMVMKRDMAHGTYVLAPASLRHALDQAARTVAEEDDQPKQEKKDVLTCPACGQPLHLAPGIDYYCPTPGCTSQQEEAVDTHKKMQEAQYARSAAALMAAMTPFFVIRRTEANGTARLLEKTPGHIQTFLTNEEAVKALAAITAGKGEVLEVLRMTVSVADGLWDL